MFLPILVASVQTNTPRHQVLTERKFKGLIRTDGAEKLRDLTTKITPKFYHEGQERAKILIQQNIVNMTSCNMILIR